MKLLNIDLDDLFIAGRIQSPTENPDLYSLASVLGDIGVPNTPNKLLITTNFDDIIALTNGFLGSNYVPKIDGDTLEIVATSEKDYSTNNIVFSGYAYHLVGDDDYIEGILLADEKEKDAISILAYGKTANEEGVEIIKIILSVPSNAHYRISGEYYDCDKEIWKSTAPEGVFVDLKEIYKKYGI